MLFIVLRRKVWWVLDGVMSPEDFYSGNSQAFRCSSFLPQVSVVWFLSPQKIFLKAEVCLDLGHSTSNVKHDATGKKDWSLLSCVLILFRFIYFVYLWLFYLHVYTCTMCVPGARWSQKGTSDLSNLELWAVVSFYIGLGNQLQVLCKSNTCSLLSHLSISPLYIT